MNLSSKGAAFVRAHEGFVAKYYVCPAGVGTIGVGFTWRSKAFRQWWKANKGGKIQRGSRMTKAEADKALLYMFKQEYGAAVNKFLGRKKVPQHVWDCMASVCYNCGPGSLKWKWAQAIKAGDYAGAARRLTNTAVTGGGKRLRGLVRRRKEEALLLSSGVYTGIGKGGHYTPSPDAMADGMLCRGERGSEVRRLIRDLKKLGHYDGVMDDRFGHGTEVAVLDFQRKHNLHADGKAGPATLRAIKEALTAPPPEPEKDLSDPAELYVEPDQDEVRSIVEDAAATDRISTTNLTAGAVGITGVGSTIGQATEALNTVESVSMTATSLQDMAVQAGPWIIAALIIGGGCYYIWRERRRKAREAKAALQ